MILEVNIPNNNILEREYVIKIILGDFLGLEYNIGCNTSDLSYSLKFGDSIIEISDCFFCKYPEPLSYLTIDSLPKEVGYFKNSYLVEHDLPVIFGSNTLLVAQNRITCGVDIFASVFFMLTRWEEVVLKDRDMHGRFPCISSLAFKNNFLHRPIVNEYVEFLWNLFQVLKYPIQRKKRYFEIVFTHDIDTLRYTSIRSVFGDILKRRDLKLFLENTKQLVTKDPYDTYDFLMKVSESMGVKSHFYFVSSDSKMPHDTGNYLKHKKFKIVLNEIRNRGHIIGFHPGYYTYQSFERWTHEKKLLEQAIEQEVTEGRQHFLRFEVPLTHRIWEKNNMICDSTLGYAEYEGFRCGTGDRYKMFDVIDRRELNLVELPLIIMDSTLQFYRKLTANQSVEIIANYISISRQYRMPLTILFHNTSFYGKWSDYEAVYRDIKHL